MKKKIASPTFFQEASCLLPPVNGVDAPAWDMQTITGGGRDNDSTLARNSRSFALTRFAQIA